MEPSGSVEEEASKLTGAPVTGSAGVKVNAAFGGWSKRAHLLSRGMSPKTVSIVTLFSARVYYLPHPDQPPVV